MRLKKILIPITLMCALLVSGCSSAESGKKSTAAEPADYGNCKVTGKQGEFKLKTIKPDTLIVKADLPSPGWYNGDTVKQIDSGVDYCLLATIAHRAGIENIKLVNASFAGLVAGKGAVSTCR